jgi:lactoylglutathione lyase
MANVIEHIGLCVTDIARAERFYTGAFGFERDRELRMPAAHLGVLNLQPPSDIYCVYLMLGSYTLELMAFDPQSAAGAADRVFNQTGLTHLSIAVDDIPETIRRARAFGGTLVSQVDRCAVLRDPEGQLVEIVAMSIHQEVEQARTRKKRPGYTT